MGLKATDRPTGMHEAQGPTLAVARAGRPMPLFSLPLSRNTHTLFRAKKYAREANSSLKTDGIEVWSAFGPSEAPVSALPKKIRPRLPKSPNGAQRPYGRAIHRGHFRQSLCANRYRASFQM